MAISKKKNTYVNKRLKVFPSKSLWLIGASANSQIALCKHERPSIPKLLKKNQWLQQFFFLQIVRRDI